ncbi:hypothetical protein [Methylobacterium pseudosasicola]|nr:hypothetical protein [Methylobacterium pseudosasicola]
MQRHAAEADRAVEGDRRFFARWPDRTYRIRLLSQAERRQVEIFQGKPLRPEPDQAVFTVMKQLAPGVRMRATVIGPLESIGEELTDAEAGSIYESYADIHPAIRQREAMMRAAVCQPRGASQDGGGR